MSNGGFNMSYLHLDICRKIPTMYTEQLSPSDPLFSLFLRYIQTLYTPEAYAASTEYRLARIAAGRCGCLHGELHTCRKSDY